MHSCERSGTPVRFRFKTRPAAILTQQSKTQFLHQKYPLQTICPKPNSIWVRFHYGKSVRKAKRSKKEKFFFKTRIAKCEKSKWIYY